MTVADPPDLDRPTGVTADPPPAGGDDPAPTRLRVPVPVWLEIGLLLAVTIAVCCGGLGLALAVVGHYSANLSLGVGLPAAVLLTLAGSIPLIGRHDRRPDRRGGQAPALTAVVLAGCYAVWNLAQSGDWLAIDRDAGVYAVTAKWLTLHDSLLVPFTSDWGSTGLPLLGSTGGVYQDGPTIEMQFDHLLPVLLAQAAHLVGDRGLLGGNALLTTLGLLAVYVAGVRLVGRPWIVLASVTGLALALPVLYVARASWSEGITMLLVWAGTWLLVRAWDARSVVLAALGGLVIGGSVMGRIDALVYLAAIPIAGGIAALLFGVDSRWRRFTLLAVAALVGAVAPVVVGTIDVEKRAGFYYRDLASQIGLLQKATLAALVVGLLALLLARPLRPVVRAVRTRVAPRRAKIAGVLGAVATLLVLFGWALRPVLDRPTGSGIPLIGGLQGREGVPVQPDRLYSEQGIVWLSWYLGVPAVALATAGLGLLVRRAVRGAPAAVLVLATAGSGTLLYLYQLSNTPDQLFGVRRYVPAVLPMFALAAAVAVAALAAALPGLLRTHARWWRAVVAVPLVALVAFPLGTSSPLRGMSPHHGLLEAIDQFCAAVGPDAALVFPDPGYGQIVAPQAFRSWCDVPVAGVTRAVTPAELSTAAASWAARGRTLWAVDASPDVLTALYGAAAVRRLGGVVDAQSDPTLTLTRPPDTYTTYQLTFYGVPVPR